MLIRTDLPDLEGYALARQLRALHPDEPPTFIALSDANQSHDFVLATVDRLNREKAELLEESSGDRPGEHLRRGIRQARRSSGFHAVHDPLRSTDRG